MSPAWKHREWRGKKQQILFKKLEKVGAEGTFATLLAEPRASWEAASGSPSLKRVHPTQLREEDFASLLLCVRAGVREREGK